MSVRGSRILAAAAVAALLCGCSKEQQTTGGGQAAAPMTHILTIADGTGDVPTLNPHLYTETTLGYITEMTQAYLVKYDEHNRPYPELVTEVPTLQNGGISKDGDTITWHLRHGVRWSDGAAFNADDVVWSTQAVLNPANNEIGRDGWDLITKVDEPDKYTVVYHLKHPYSPYLPTFFGSAGANPDVLPKHLLAQYPNINNVAYNAKPVGIGPFRVAQWKRGESIELEPNPYYFRGMPKLKHITYKLIPSFDTLVTQMQTGEVDLWPDLPASFIDRALAITRNKTVIAPSPYYAHLDFNLSHPIVADVRVREAIRYAIDRKSLAQKITHGYSELQESVVPPVVPGAPTAAQVPFVGFDPAKAKQLLDEAGWKVGPDGIRVKNGQRLALQFPYYTGSSTADNTVEFIRASLKAVGVEIDTRQYAPAMFFESPNGIVYGGKFDITMFSWQALPNADISNNWECNQIPPNGQNVTHYCNKELDAMLERVKNTYDPAVQQQLLAKECKIIADNVPTIVIYVLDQANSYNPNLTGFHPGTWTPFDEMLNVDI